MVDPKQIKRLTALIETVRADGAMADESVEFATDMSEALRRVEELCTEARDALHYADMAHRKAREALDKAELTRIALVQLFDKNAAAHIKAARERDRQ